MLDSVFFFLYVTPLLLGNLILKDSSSSSQRVSYFLNFVCFTETVWTSFESFSYRAFSEVF